MAIFLYNMYFVHDDGTTTQHLNIEGHRVPEILAMTKMETVKEYRVVKVK